MSDASQDPAERPYVQLARRALESPAGQATVTLLLAQHAAVHGLLDLDKLPSIDPGAEGPPDVLAALDAVVDSGGWRDVGLVALRDSDEPAALMRDATKSYMQDLRMLCNHVLNRAQTLGVEMAIDPGTLALAASDPSYGIARHVIEPPEAAS